MLNTRIYAVAGAKGGVGKTTTSINLATAIATRGASTVVVELDLAMANLVDFLDLPTGLDEAPTVHEVLAGQAAPPAAIRDAPGRLDVLPSGVTLDGFTGASVDRLPALLDPLLGEYDRIVLDTGAGLSRETVVPVGLADEVILVSTPRVAAVRDVEKTKRLAERVGTPVGGVVFTKSGTGSAPPPPELADFLDTELLGHVPEDSAVPASQDAGQPVVSYASDSEAATAYQRIATTLDKRAVRGQSVTERSFELPRLDAIDDRAAAEGPATDSQPADARDAVIADDEDRDGALTATDAERQTDAISDAEPSGAETDDWQFGRRSVSPDSEADATATPRATDRDQRETGTAPDVSTDADTADLATANSATTGAATTDDGPAASDGEPLDTSTAADEADGSVTERESENGKHSDEQDSTLRDRAKSLIGL